MPDAFLGALCPIGEFVEDNLFGSTPARIELHIPRTRDAQRLGNRIDADRALGPIGTSQRVLARLPCLHRDVTLGIARQFDRAARWAHARTDHGLHERSDFGGLERAGHRFHCANFAQERTATAAGCGSRIHGIRTLEARVNQLAIQVQTWLRITVDDSDVRPVFQRHCMHQHRRKVCGPVFEHTHTVAAHRQATARSVPAPNVLPCGGKSTSLRGSLRPLAPEFISWCKVVSALVWPTARA